MSAFRTETTGGSGSGSGNVTGTGSAGQVAFWTSLSNIDGDSNLFWNNIDKALGLGTNSDVLNFFGFSFPLQFIQRRDDTYLTFGGYVQENAGSSSPIFIGAFSGGSLAVPTIVSDSSITLEIIGLGFDGTTNLETGEIIFQVDGPPGLGSMPGRLVFTTTPTGSGVSLERMRIDNQGFVGIGTVAPATLLHVEGDVTLPASGGIIFAGASTYIHSSGASSFFAGITAGNLTNIGLFNTGIGQGALNGLTIGTDDVAVGFNALTGTTDGSRNTALGSQAMQSNVTGFDNVAVGAQALVIATGARNVAVGSSAGFSQTNASDNTLVGGGAGNPITTGGGNTFVGNNTGVNCTDGTENTLFGHSAGFEIDSLTFATAIGAGALVGASNSIVLGASTQPIRVGIGINSPTSKLHVRGADILLENSAQVSITSRTAASSNPLFNLQRAGSSLAAPTAVLNTNFLGELRFQGYNGISYTNTGASIHGVATETYTGTTNAGRLVFNTTPSGSTVPVERMRINPDGTVAIKTTTIPTNTMFVVDGGNITVSDTSDPALIASHTAAGRSISIGAGAVNSGAFFDQDGDFIINSDTKANVDAGVLSGTNRVTVQGSTGNVGIGTTAPAASAKLDIDSTTGALLIPRMTTAQKNALTAVNGMIVYDSTLDKFQGYEAGSWTSFI